MAILIKDPETERKARELATLKGESLTGVIDSALDRALADALPKRRPTATEIVAATDRMRASTGIRGPVAPITRQEWDEINEIPGLEDEA